MTAFNARRLASLVMPARVERGLVLMLAAYFDDSGTHRDSKVAVWGGVVGRVERFDEFEKSWSQFLSEPLPGKPRLRKFALADCAGSHGEFYTYKPAERDAVRYTAREIMRRANLQPLVFSIPADDWKRILRGRPGRALGPASLTAFMGCAARVIDIGLLNDRAPIPVIFDKGQKDHATRSLVHYFEEEADKAGVQVSYSFAPVEGTPGLQAADTIATEFYWYNLARRNNPDSEASPHLTSLMEMTGADPWTVTSHEIESIRKQFLAKFPLFSSWNNRRR